MISEGLCETEDWSKDAENSALITEITFYSVLIVILNCKNISQNYNFFCIFDQIDTAYSCVHACVYVCVFIN